MILKTVANIETRAVVERTSAAIKAEISEGKTALEDGRVRAEIYMHLKNARYDKLLPLFDSPDRLMAEFAKMLISIWPGSPEYFDRIQMSLKPLANIATILKPESLNESVQLWGGHCYMKDPRLTIVDFKKILWQQTFEPSELESGGQPATA